MLKFIFVLKTIIYLYSTNKQIEIMEAALETLIEKKFYLKFRLTEDWKDIPEVKINITKKIKEIEEAINILELIVKIKNK